MGHLYSAENHDWDLTLKAAHMLLESGFHSDLIPRTGNLSMGFAHFTGSMMLSFCAIESYSASIALTMSNDNNYESFDHSAYQNCRRFKDKLNLIFSAIPYSPDWSQGLFQKITKMQEWRNLVAHASPYKIDETEIPNTTSAPRKLHKPFEAKSYLRLTELKPAKEFYETACEYISLIESLTNLNPRAQVRYVVGHDELNG